MITNNPPNYHQYQSFLLASGFLFPKFQEAGSDANRWWLWALLILIVPIVLIWWFWSNRKTTQVSTPVNEDTALRTPTPSIKTSADDLSLIEGIGPKISSLFQEAGISTFKELAATDTDRLAQILKDGGIRLADPTTWAEQARLAASGDMEGLSALQDRLKGGRRV